MSRLERFAFWLTSIVFGGGALVGIIWLGYEILSRVVVWGLSG